MDKINKFLKKLRKQERNSVKLVMLQLTKNYMQVPGVKKLKGNKNLYRVRLGRVRIVFKAVGLRGKIIKVSNRDERTYKS